MHIEIEYCVVCGLLDLAVDTQRALLETHGRDLDAVALKTGHGGVFKIRADGEEIFDSHDDGYDLDEIHRQVEERMAA